MAVSVKRRETRGAVQPDARDALAKADVSRTMNG